ncbi:MAG: class III extradiol ring-cleavage dioxygenase [Myxococcota bacterium]
MSTLRRPFLLGAAAAMVGGPRLVQADEPTDASALPPVVYVGHGGPNLAISRVRGEELGAWGQRFPPVRGVVAVTPHYRARGIELGAVAEAPESLYSFPTQFRRQLQGMRYPLGDNRTLAERVREVLEAQFSVAASARTGVDHTTWMSLVHLFPEGIPVVEVALPVTHHDRDLFALGQALRPLRSEGLLIHCSGNATHNLAAMRARNTPAEFARTFDAWVRDTLQAGDVDALINWRRAAPNPYVAHPDDGGHFDVLLVGLGAAGSADGVAFPVEGFEMATLSKRCIELPG